MFQIKEADIYHNLLEKEEEELRNIFSTLVDENETVKSIREYSYNKGYITLRQYNALKAIYRQYLKDIELCKLRMEKI